MTSGMHGMGTCIFNAGQIEANSKTELEGPVQSVSFSAGAGYPSFAVLAGNTTVTVIASPYRTLLDAGFQVSAGDRVKVIAYALSGGEGQYLAAEINNLTTGQSLKLRDENGVPLALRGRGPCSCGTTIR